MRTILIVLSLATAGLAFSIPASAAPGCDAPLWPPTSPPPGQCRGDPGDDSLCVNGTGPGQHNYGECAQACDSLSDPECVCEDGVCYEDYCQQEEYRDYPTCKGGDGGVGCAGDGALVPPMVPGITHSHDCRGGDGGDGSGWAPGGKGGTGCENPGGIIIGLPGARCEGGEGGESGPNGPGRARGGAGCKGGIVIELGTCKGGAGDPPGADCEAWLYGGLNCGVGGYVFCDTVQVGYAEHCEVVPGLDPQLF